MVAALRPVVRSASAGSGTACGGTCASQIFEHVAGVDGLQLFHSYSSYRQCLLQEAVPRVGDGSIDSAHRDTPHLSPVTPASYSHYLENRAARCLSICAAA